MIQLILSSNVLQWVQTSTEVFVEQYWKPAGVRGPDQVAEEEEKNDKQIKFLTNMVDKMSEELASCRNALIRMETSPPAGSLGSSHSSDAAAMEP